MTPPTPKEPEVIAATRIRVRFLENENVLTASQSRELAEKCAMLDAYDALKAERDAAVQRSEYWKANHLAGNAEIDELRTRLAAAEQKNTRVLDIARRLAVRSGFAAEALKELDAALTPTRQAAGGEDA